MHNIDDLSHLCRDGRINEAYDIAVADCRERPTDVYCLREAAAVLTHKIRRDLDEKKLQDFHADIDIFKRIPLLNCQNASAEYNNLLFQFADYIYKSLIPNNYNTTCWLSKIFDEIKAMEFAPGPMYSYMLRAYLKNDKWPRLMEFIEWWNLDKLTANDFAPYKNGKINLVFASQAYRAYGRLLLANPNIDKIQDFLPRIFLVMQDHKGMSDLGYLYAKLLVAANKDRNDILKIILPYARKKRTEPWLWNFLCDLCPGDTIRQLACCLRSVHCKADEIYLSPVRYKLIRYYIYNKDYNRAKYNIKLYVDARLQSGYRIPGEISEYMKLDWYVNSVPDGSDPIEYLSITNEIIYGETTESIAIVVRTDPNSGRAAFVYGEKKIAFLKLNSKGLSPGSLLKITYSEDSEGHLTILKDNVIQKLPEEINYIKHVSGKVVLKCMPFGTLHSSPRAHIPTSMVRENELSNGETIDAIIVNDYDKKKDRWGWKCVKILNKTTK